MSKTGKNCHTAASMARFARVFPAASGAPSRFAAGARPTLILDLDETVLHRSRGTLDTLLLYAVPTASVGDPFPGAINALNRLAARFRIVAVTARWSLAASNTVRWLAAHGLAGMPLIHATRPHPGDASRVAFKADAIAWLRATGWKPVRAPRSCTTSAAARRQPASRPLGPRAVLSHHRTTTPGYHVAPFAGRWCRRPTVGLGGVRTHRAARVHCCARRWVRRRRRWQRGRGGGATGQGARAVVRAPWDGQRERCRHRGGRAAAAGRGRRVLCEVV